MSVGLWVNQWMARPAMCVRVEHSGVVDDGEAFGGAFS
ncbi:MAG: hypothetical protein JWR37_2904, partial [Mycobacterium sp.]|nr:hypothetical protein [Mycobacterium sp.]